MIPELKRVDGKEYVDPRKMKKHPVVSGNTAYCFRRKWLLLKDVHDD